MWKKQGTAPNEKFSQILVLVDSAKVSALLLSPGHELLLNGREVRLRTSYPDSGSKPVAFIGAQLLTKCTTTTSLSSYILGYSPYHSHTKE